MKRDAADFELGNILPRSNTRISDGSNEFSTKVSKRAAAPAPLPIMTIS